MNCQEFSLHAAELARGGMLEAAAREGAHAHAEACAACSARLARERSLSAALRLTVEGMSGEAAPARVGETLLAAFRESRDGGRAPAFAPPAASPAAARVSAARFPVWRRRALAASAVAASLVLTFTVARRAQQQQQTDAPARTDSLAANSSHTPAQTGAAAPVAETTDAQSETNGGARAVDGAETAGVVGTGGGARPGRMRLAAGAKSKKRALAEIAATFEYDGGEAVHADGGGGSPAETANAAPAAAETESLTDFVPVAAGANSGPLDGGQLVRVKVPRAALASLGLPVDAERADETVKADLLLAHDGTARAIRLVR